MTINCDLLDYIHNLVVQSARDPLVKPPGNQHTGKKEGLEQNQQPGQQQDKNNQTTQQELEKSNNLSQDQLHKQEQDKKESQKTGVADEQKNNTGQHKKRGVHIK